MLIKRAFAAAVRPEYRDELAARNVEVETVVDRRLAEPLDQPADRDMGACRGMPVGTRVRLGCACARLLPASAVRHRPSGSECLADISLTSTFCSQRSGLHREVDEFLIVGLVLGGQVLGHEIADHRHGIDHVLRGEGVLDEMLARLGGVAR